MGIRGVYHASKGPERSRPREIAFGQFTTSSLLQPDPPTPFKFTGRLGLHSPWESSRALALSIAPVPSTCPTSRSVEYGNLKSGQALLNTDRFLPEVARNWRRGDDRNSLGAMSFVQSCSLREPRTSRWLHCWKDDKGRTLAAFWDRDK
jgi:hypothetical protein